MTISDRAFGINVLRYWWDETPLAALNFSTFQDAITNYDKIDSLFIDTLGKTTRKLDQTKVKSAFKKLAIQKGTVYPSRADFSSALVSAFGQLDFSDYGKIAKDAAIDTISDIGNLGSKLVFTYVVVLAAGVVLYFVVMKDGKKLQWKKML